MIIPVVFSLHPLYEYNVQVFIKGVCFAKAFGWPVFAQKKIADIDAYPQWLKESVYSEEVARAMEHIPFQRHYLQAGMCEVFPPEIIDRYLRAYPSRTDAQLASTSQPWPEMSDYLARRVREIEKARGEKAEAFMAQTAPRFVQDAARALGIPVIDYELSAFRSPVYQKSARIDFKGSIGDGELSERYRAFCQMKEDVPIFTKREILSVMLNDVYLERCFDKDIEPEYEAGVALGYNIPHVFTAYNQCSSIEMVIKAQETFGSDKVCARYHPGDPVHAKIDRVKEDKGSLYDFIRKCKRIVCCTSNIAYEAMLYNRPAYEMGWSQIADYANKDLDEVKDVIADDCFLSFMAFGYFAPIELLNDVDYLRWRLSKPSEKEIYEYHLHYILNCRGIGRDVLSCTADRLNQIMRARGYPAGRMDDLCDRPIWLETDHVSELMIQHRRLEAAMETQKCALKEKEATLLNADATIQKLRKELEATLLSADATIHQLRAELEQTRLSLMENQNQLQAVLGSKTYRWSRRIADRINRLVKRK